MLVVYLEPGSETLIGRRFHTIPTRACATLILTTGITMVFLEFGGFANIPSIHREYGDRDPCNGTLWLPLFRTVATLSPCGVEQ